MIQRVQTLFLLAALIVTSLTIKVPNFTFVENEENIYNMMAYGLVTEPQNEILKDTLPIFAPLAAIFVITGILILISIFLYKKRILQMRICIFSILLLFGSILMELYYFKWALKNFTITGHTYRIGLIMPLIAIIALYLAFTRIRKDELLIKSLNRIR